MKNLKIFQILLASLMIVMINGSVFAQSCPVNTQYGPNYATLAGAITDTGGENNVQVWFEWGTSSNLGNLTPQQSVYVTSLPYRFCYSLSNLQPCTTYYYRAAIRNSLGTSYGQIYSFTTRCSNPSPDPLLVSCYALPNPASVNTPITFYANVSGGVGSYNYSWSGACASSNSTCSRTFSSPGNYLANLTVTSGSFTRTTTCSVNIIQQSSDNFQNQPPVPVIAFTPEDIRPGTMVTFDASQSYDPDGFISSYRWEINGDYVSNRVSFNRALASGVYRIKLTVVDNNGSQASKEILISVGKTAYITRTRIVTRTVTSTRVVMRTVNSSAELVSSRLVNFLLEKTYKVKICSKNELQFSLINNTSVNRKVTITANGEAGQWFVPQSKTFVLKPYETLVFKWEVNIPCTCNIEEGVYEVNFKVSTADGLYEFSTFLEAKKEGTSLSPLIGFIAGIFGGWNFLWIVLLILLILNAYLWYKLFRKRETQT